MRLVTVEQSCRVLTGSLFKECNSQVRLIADTLYILAAVVRGPVHFIHSAFFLPLPVCFKVDAEPYVEMCVEAACSCPSVGDCVCFCDVIAAYAQACSEKGVNINWRSNDLCREFEDILLRL